MPNEIVVADRAAKRIVEILKGSSPRIQGLRVQVVGAGRFGLQCKFDLDMVRAGDQILERNGARVLMDIKSLLYLQGAELDYKEGLTESGFVFNNPHLEEACGCGSSFPAYPESPDVPNIW